MKTFCLIFFSCLTACPAAAQLTDWFTDGDFTSSPSWNGDTAAWQVDRQLRLNTRDTAVSQEVYLSTPLPNSKSAKWEFLLQMNFDPSAANRFRIYLFSDRPNLEGPLNGYFLQVGESGPEDGYDLYRQDSAQVTCIFRGRSVQRPAADTLRCRFSIRRDTSGAWEIRMDTSGGRDFRSYGFLLDGSYGTGGYFGLLARYTATRSGRFFFDDLSVSNPGPAPVIPPLVAEWGTLRITEVFPDPTPVRGLPEAEFFELYNTADSTVNLLDWTWSDGNTVSRFGNDSIPAGGYLIVCHPRDTAVFSAYGLTAGLPSFPSLNNSGDRLKLFAPYGRLIDSLSYKDYWYRDPEKKNGGISLERITLSVPCFPEAGWSGSEASAGGTPGAAGSLGDAFTNRKFTIRHFKIKDQRTLEIVFSTFLPAAAALKAANYRLNNGALVEDVRFTADRQGILLALKTPLRRGRLYRLNIGQLADCYGNVLKDREREFLLPQLPVSGDVIINEILFNPAPGGADFVEIYNRSEKILDLSHLQLASGAAGDSLKGAVALADSTILFYPGEYRLLTRYPKKIMAHYITSNRNSFLGMERFPAYYNESGSCILLSGEVQIDRFDYVEDMHFQLIADPEGISLEKVHFDLPAGQKGVFRSAAATAGYATPGYRNSQFLEGGGVELLTLTNPVFSPGNVLNGRLFIRYRFPETNLVANIHIFDAGGRVVRRLAGNHLLGTDGSLTWDGRDDSGALLETGIYIVYAEVFSENGRVKRFKKTCVLTRPD